MVKFTSKNIRYNVNVTHEHPLKEFVTLFVGLLLILFITYFILGAVLNIIIARIPEKFENTIARFYSFEKFELAENDEQQSYVQGILDKLLVHMPEDGRNYQVAISGDEGANAFALPGGNILILSGLLNEAESENEVAMVLAHELGHFANNDHLSSLSRGIVVAFLSSIVFGNNSSVTNFVSGTFSRLDMRFSREQESSADFFGLKLLNESYGHVAGATDFFERMKKHDKYMKYLKFMSTHPLSEERIKDIEKMIAKNGYLQEEKIPLQL